MNTFYRSCGKRLIDLTLATTGAIILSPILCLVALLVWLRLGKPVLFRQQRGGYRGARFILNKFRTMLDRRDENGRLLPDEDRMESFGIWLRRLSLDELPQLWNVIRGDMSIVGPRPLSARYLDRYTTEQARRHDVIPGITGWAQVNGRNAIRWEEKFDLDTWYVDHFSFGLDIKILWLTVVRVISRDDVSQEGHATMCEFMGTNVEE